MRFESIQLAIDYRYGIIKMRSSFDPKVVMVVTVDGSLRYIKINEKIEYIDGDYHTLSSKDDILKF